MAFPTTPILEDFAGTGALSSNWTTSVRTAWIGTPERLSGVCVGTASEENAAYWDVEEFLDSEVYLTVPSVASGAVRGNVLARIQSPASASFDAYEFNVRFDTDSYELIRWIDDADTAIDSGSVTLDPGDKVGMYVRNSGDDIVIEMYLDTGSGWSLLDSFTDTGAVSSFPSLAASGFIGFRLFGDGLSDTRSIDDFGGGEFTEAADFIARPPMHSRGTSW